MYYMGFTWEDTYKIPVPYKKWFIERLTKELNGKGGDDNNPQPLAQSRALHQNDPQTRALQGLDRAQVPSRLRRFT